MDTKEMELDSSSLDDVQNLITDIAFNLANTNAPVWFIHVDYSVIFGEQSSFDSIVDACPLSFPPSLQAVLESDEPPPFEYWFSLPPPTYEHFAIYAIPIQKAGHPDRLYFGSGTNPTQGVKARTVFYTPDNVHTLPSLVKKAFEEGYHVAHIGMVCWTRIPSTGLIPRARGLFLVLEATFTVLFHACVPSLSDLYVEHLLLWPREAVSWEPLCSHLSLTEAVRGGIHMSTEELEHVAAIRSSRASELKNKSNEKYVATQRAKDVVAWKAKCDAKAKRHYARRTGKVLDTAAKTKQKAKESQRFFCEYCGLSSSSQANHDVHLTTQGHLDRVQGIEKAAPSAAVLAQASKMKDKRATAKSNNAFHCPICDTSFGNKRCLDRHLRGPMHEKRRRKAEEAGEAEEGQA